MLNTQVFENTRKANAKILVVTKYWDSKITQEILAESQSKYPEVFFWTWENRIENIKNKNLPREQVHFIGNIQSQNIAEIVASCSTIHSLASLKHAQKIENQNLQTQAFIQIRLDKNKDIWIVESELWGFLQACKNYKNLKIIGISGMGSTDLSEQEKRKEFKKLLQVRDTYLPEWIISAGTSRDYEIALEEWVDVVRVGNAILAR